MTQWSLQFVMVYSSNAEFFLPTAFVIPAIAIHYSEVLSIAVARSTLCIAYKILYLVYNTIPSIVNPDFIKVNMKSATFAKKKPNKINVMYLNKDDVLSLSEYLLNNIYVKYRDNIFRQVIGVPMGTDCAPDLANLFLFFSSTST